MRQDELPIEWIVYYNACDLAGRPTWAIGMVMLSGTVGVDIPSSCPCFTLAGTESACLLPTAGGTLSDVVSVIGNDPWFLV